MAFLMSLPFMFRSKVGDMKFSIPQSFLPGDIGDKGAPFHSVLGALVKGVMTPDSALRVPRALQPSRSLNRRHTRVYIYVCISLYFIAVCYHIIFCTLYIYIKYNM